MSCKIKVYFDTEFTNFRKYGNEPKLISLGCVSERGDEFYCELSDTYQVDDCSDFVLSTVLPMLNDSVAKLTEVQVAIQLKSWVERFKAEVLFVSDAPRYDWPFIQSMFVCNGWPDNLMKKCFWVDFKSNEHERFYENQLSQYWIQNPKLRHHSLEDAKGMRFALLATSSHFALSGFEMK